MNKKYQTIILGGGISGLTVAHKLRLYNPGHRFLILDKAKRTGGVIKTQNDHGYISEIGPHGFLDNCEESKQILAETGLDRECVKAPLIDFVRYVYYQGRLNLIPQTPGKILMAPLIPWHAKLRVVADLWKPFLEGEPSVAKWASYRFGKAMLPYIDAIYTGTYAGDYDRLTIDSVMPGVRALERKHGSVLRGLFAKMRNKRKEGAKGEKSFNMPAMTSFPSGMQRLPERLAEPFVVGRDLSLGTTIVAVVPHKSGWQVTTTKGSFYADNVVFALPINAALQLLKQIDQSLPEKSVPETWIATVVFGFENDVEIPPGFGFLTPEKEQQFILGTLFSSNMFPARAPKDHVVIETLVGGRRHPERLELDDQTLTRRACKDVQKILQLTKKPVYTSVLRSGGGIPQLERNYPQLLTWRNNFLDSHSGLHICGFGWEGIGLNDMMKGACRTAEMILSSADRTKYGSELKGVYF